MDSQLAQPDPFADARSMADLTPEDVATLPILDGLRTYQKEELEGVPFIIASVTFREGDFGPYATMDIISEHDRGVLHDGSTGIYRQLRTLTQDGQNTRLLVRRGLRRSDYVGPTGKNSTTWYLSA